VSLGEYRTRLWMGLVMALVAAGVLAIDGRLAAMIGVPLYPCLFGGVLLLAVFACVELRALLRGLGPPPAWLMIAAAVTVFLANWPAHLVSGVAPDSVSPAAFAPLLNALKADPFRHVAYALAAWVLIAFLYELATYRTDNNAVTRLALFCFSLAYVGLLPAFLVQLRFSPGDDARGAAAVGALIAVTKGGDIGAYFTGRFLGRHRMTPLLSPKKTWQGFFGGLAASAGVAVALHFADLHLFGSVVEAVLFGLVLGVTGVLGDLAESLIKRDCGAKDASQTVPGFGGILDVVDSVVFAAPVAYWWLTFGRG
jgi:phosphatidate cytidylyltransferase